MNYVKSFNLFGVEAQQIPCITGEGEPTATTEGTVGCFYMDTNNGDTYKCVSIVDGVYTWEKIASQKDVSATQEVAKSYSESTYGILHTTNGFIPMQVTKGTDANNKGSIYFVNGFIRKKGETIAYSAQTINLGYQNGFIKFDTETATFKQGAGNPGNNLSKVGENEILIATYSNYGADISSPSLYAINGYRHGIFNLRKTITPNYEWLPVGGTTLWSDFCFVNNKFLMFKNSTSEEWTETESNTTGRLFIYNADDFTAPILTLKHNFGHCNTVHYCEQTDKLLVGNLPGNSTYKGALYIFDNVSDWLELTENSFLDINTLNPSIVNLADLPNVSPAPASHISAAVACWGARNMTDCNTVWVNLFYGRYWLKLLLGQGENDLSLLEKGGGTYTATSADKFNGTFLVLEYYLYTNLANTNTEVIQGIDYVDGQIRTSNGHNHMLGFVWDFTNGVVERDRVENKVYNPDGSIYSAMSEGYTVHNGYAYQGFLECQANSDWNPYPATPNARRYGIMKYKI